MRYYISMLRTAVCVGIGGRGPYAPEPENASSYILFFASQLLSITLSLPNSNDVPLGLDEFKEWKGSTSSSSISNL